MKQVDAKRLVVIDECGSNIALTPLYARAPKGQRACGSVPRNRGENITLLAPSLVAGQIVELDNLSVHKGERVRQLIEARGCELLFLPAYSPDYSCIEETFSKLKAFLQRVGARTHEALQEAISQALETVTAQDALGWFTHCGFHTAQASDL